MVKKAVLFALCALLFLFLAACTDEELHEALCSDRSHMSWKEKFFCLVYKPDIQSNPLGQPNKNPLYYGCDSPPHSEDACVSLAIHNYQSQNICPSNPTPHFEKVKCELKMYNGEGNHWDCYINVQC